MWLWLHILLTLALAAPAWGRDLSNEECLNFWTDLSAASKAQASSVLELIGQIERRLQTASLQSRVGAAFRSLLVDYKNRVLQSSWILPPLLDANRIESSRAELVLFNGGPSEVWTAHLAKELERAPAHGSDTHPIAMERPTMGNTSSVFRVKIDGKTGYFRPIGEGEKDASLATYLATQIASDMKIGSAPAGRFVRVNGTLGFLSDEVPGVRGRDFENLSFFSRLGRRFQSRATQLDPRASSDMAAFQFLIGNMDVTRENYHVTDQGIPVCFDFNFAFRPGMHMNAPNNTAVAGRSFDVVTPYGRTLPDKYTPEFVRHLRETLTPEVIRARYGPFLQGGRLEALLFRRELILRDVQLRGEGALFR